MENIYEPRSNKLIDLNTFSIVFNQHLIENPPKTTSEICDAMNLTETPEKFQKLLEQVDLESHLDQIDDIFVDEFDPSVVFTTKRLPVEYPRNALKLRSVKIRLENETTENTRKLDRLCRYSKNKFIKTEKCKEFLNLIPSKEVLLTIRFYEPFFYDRGSKNNNPKFAQEFQVVGSNLLTELRDKIYCQCNYGPFFDISENPFEPTPELNRDPGFFFITDTFYNDMRNPSNPDYSKVIRDWANKKKDITQLNVAPMENTFVRDLKIKLGYPQVYRHYGNCEHLFTVASVRLLQSCDSLALKDYPQITMISNTKTVMCSACGHILASVLIKNCNEHLSDPEFLCKTCFESFHYVDGKKIGEFRAYRYYGSQPIAQPNLDEEILS